MLRLRFDDMRSAAMRAKQQLELRLGLKPIEDGIPMKTAGNLAFDGVHHGLVHIDHAPIGKQRSHWQSHVVRWFVHAHTIRISVFAGNRNLSAVASRMHDDEAGGYPIAAAL